eukprot:45216-Rhodomonas_salina.1
MACANGLEGMARLLVEKNADVKARNNRVRHRSDADFSGQGWVGTSVWRWLARSLVEGDVSGVLSVVSAFVSVNNNMSGLTRGLCPWQGDTSLVLALDERLEGVARLLVEKNADVDAQNYDVSLACSLFSLRRAA